MSGKKKRTMLCPYRVWTEVVPPVLRGQGEFTKQGFYECLKEDCICYRRKITDLCVIEKCVRGGSDDVFITELEVKEQKWHVVADGDLPPKRPKRGFLYLYIVTYNYEDGPMINPRTGLAWYDCKGEWIGYNEEIDDFESGDVLAWRELPEPWEGANNE